jgi:hypothetical protein
MVYPALLPLMRTLRLPAIDWTGAPADLNGLVRFAERQNLVSARVPSHLKRSPMKVYYDIWLVPNSVILFSVAGRHFHCLFGNMEYCIGFTVRIMKGLKVPYWKMWLNTKCFIYSTLPSVLYITLGTDCYKIFNKERSSLKLITNIF